MGTRHAAATPAVRPCVGLAMDRDGPSTGRPWPVQPMRPNRQTSTMAPHSNPHPIAMDLTHRPLTQPLLALLGACVLTLAPPAADAASANARRLQIQIEFTRHGDVRNGAERGRQKLVQQWTLSALLQGDGTPMVNNPLDRKSTRLNSSH